jgi:hypothetical protein
MNLSNRYRSRWIGGGFLGGAVLAAVLLIVIALFDARAAATGWLVGFAFWAQILIGSLTLLMIHRLTSGRWGVIAAPVIAPAAAAVPLLVLLAAPLFIAIPALYPWSDPTPTIKPDVLSYYLNILLFIIRSIVALIGWSALALLLPRTEGRRGQLLAAVGLVFHALVISSIAIDWYLSLEPPFTSSSFGASVAISSLVGALAFTALLVPAAEDEPALGDLGGLLLATVLGVTYIDFMAVLVIWYGDLPREEIWFVEREQLSLAVMAVAAFLFASLIPVLALLLSRIRNRGGPLRAVGACVLVGLACYNAYLVAPPAGTAVLPAALIAIVGIGFGLIALFAAGRLTAVPSPREPVDAR